MSSEPYAGCFPLSSPERKVLVTPHPQLHTLKPREVSVRLFTKSPGNKAAAPSQNTFPPASPSKFTAEEITAMSLSVVSGRTLSRTIIRGMTTAVTQLSSDFSGDPSHFRG